MHATLRPLIAAALSSCAITAQCSNEWLLSGQRPGLAFGSSNSCYGNVAIEWDPDGSGPATPLIVVGGQFDSGNLQGPRNIAIWDPATERWSNLLGRINGVVQALVILSNGELVASGTFTQAGAAPANNIARWDGTQWQPLGQGLNTSVVSLRVMSNGNLAAGGSFQWSGTQPMAHVAAWNGSQWLPLGAGLDNTVSGLSNTANGGLLAAGSFANSGQVPTLGVARWTGTAWTAIGGGCRRV